jgi:rSAM/selenodomain-associated transferase 1
MASRTLLLFTKPAVPGRVKTRLIATLAPEQAAELHSAFVQDLAERLRFGAFETRVAWALDPDDPVPDGPVPGVSLGFPGSRQQGRDLGERLHRALATAAAGGGAVAAVGSDHPALSIERIEEAFAHVESGAAVVLGPATDGGYYLIALAAAAVQARLFDGIAWSTGAVLASTLERCAELGLEPTLLQTESDVDTAEDLRRLAASLIGSDRGCPRTRALLGVWGWLNAAPAIGAPV